MLPDFANEPKNLYFPSPRIILNPDRIRFGDGCHIGKGSVLAACSKFETGLADQKFDSVIILGKGVWATSALQVFSAVRVEIDDSVMIAANVFISDYQHGYEDANSAYKDQPLAQIAPIRIGTGCWIGQNVVIMPGVTIGEFSIIGANSVVTKSVPKQSIAVGSPARVLKQWDHQQNCWKSVDKK